MTEFDQLNKVLDRRYSCRGYQADPVPRPVLEQIFETAQKVPSWCNSQPWMVSVLSGEKLMALSADLKQAALQQKGAPDVAFPERYSGEHKTRRSVCGWQLYGAIGVEKGDRDGARAAMMRNYDFFGAPHVAVISTPKELGPYGVLDCGAFVTAVTLAAAALGVATIPQAAPAEFSDVVRRHVDLPQDRDVLCTIAMGYEDSDHPANGFRTERAPMSEVVRFS